MYSISVYDYTKWKTICKSTASPKFVQPYQCNIDFEETLLGYVSNLLPFLSSNVSTIYGPCSLNMFHSFYSSMCVLLYSSKVTLQN